MRKNYNEEEEMLAYAASKAIRGRTIVSIQVLSAYIAIGMIIAAHKNHLGVLGII